MATKIRSRSPGCVLSATAKNIVSHLVRPWSQENESRACADERDPGVCEGSKGELREGKVPMTFRERLRQAIREAVACGLCARDNQLQWARYNIISCDDCADRVATAALDEVLLARRAVAQDDRTKV